MPSPRWSHATAAATAATSSTPPIVLLAIGIAGSSAYDKVVEGRLAPGQSLAVGDYRLTYRSLERARGRERDRDQGPRSTSSATARRLGTVEAGKNAYTAERQVSNEVGIRSDLVTGEDLFVIAEQINPNGTVYFRIFVKPLVNLIWLAGLVFLLGSLITLWPDAREQRRLALRYAAPKRPRGRDPRACCSGRCSPSAASSSSRCRTCASPTAGRDALDEPGELEQRRLALAE